MKNNPIGIIDSGVGGLTIASKIIENLPKEPVIYLADSKNCPYGNKTSKEIYNLTKIMVKFLIKNNAKLIIIACNTITVTCIDKLRKDFPQIPIVGMVPVIKTAAELTKNKKIGVFSTKITSESKYQKDLINKFAKETQVISAGSSDLVPLIESLDFDSISKSLPKELELFKEKEIDVLALGCSHFSLVKNQIQKFLPDVLILDSSNAVIRQVQKVLENNSLLSNSKNPSYNFYTTGGLKTMQYFLLKLTKNAKVERISLDE